MSTSLRKNVVANFVGNGLTALISLAVIPLYIRLLGIESYGLIGFFATLQAVFSLLDMGLGATVNREFALMSVEPGRAQAMRDLLRTIEFIYWGVGIAIGMVVVVFSPVIAEHWLNTAQLPVDQVKYAVAAMGVSLACRWPFTLYSGGLLGLQHQVLLNVVRFLTEAVRAAGALLVLWFYARTVVAFFLWQIVIGVTTTALAAVALWSRIPVTGQPARFSRGELRRVSKFAAGMGGISILAVILLQLDKVILSRILTLEAFGYYSLATVLAGALSQVFGPIFVSFYPRLTQLVQARDGEGLKRLYHGGCQWMSVILLPVAIVAALFSHEILLLWTHDATTADRSAPIFAVLIVGTAMNGLMNLPYALQLAHGWTRLAFLGNLVAVLLLGPLIVFMALNYGAIGAAWVWVILNAGYILLTLYFMHRRLLPGELGRWYRIDVGAPLLGVGAALGVGVWILRLWGLDIPAIPKLLCFLLVGYGAAGMATPYIRAWLLKGMQRLKCAVSEASR